MTRSTHPIVQLTALGSGELMPALVMGFEGDEAKNGGTLEIDFAPPSWLFEVSVQAGGYAMSYYNVVGAVFRLADNAGQALRDIAPLLRVFHLMAEDPDIRTLRKEHLGLLPLVGTWGESYSPAQLRTLESFLRRYYQLPAPSGGLEAFVRLGEVPARELVGWKQLHTSDPSVTLEDAGALAAVFTEQPFGLAEGYALSRVGAQAFARRSPALFLVWENSD